MKSTFLLLFVLVFSKIYGQDSSKVLTIQSTVYDSLNRETIPFASIYKLRDRKGTSSDFDGVFTLENVLPNDTIVCSYIGYEKTIIVPKFTTDYDTIYLNRESQLIDEVMVLADNSILYALIQKSRKKQSPVSHIAKTYFELETFHGDDQLELFQGYYNGTIKGYNMDHLEMKNARFALAPLSKRIFASTESSKAMHMHKLMSKNDYFPTTPFELRKSQLRRHYRLYLSSKYRNDQNQTIYVIKFEPKQFPERYFKGKVWIDSASHLLTKVELKNDNTSLHPFRAIWPTHELNNVQLEMTKTFATHNDQMVLSSMDFNYKLNYTTIEDSTLNISTRAMLNAYNHNTSFKLPFFRFPQTSNSDYRRIQILPKSPAFWECEDEYKLINNSTSRSNFINEVAVIKTHDLFDADSLFNRRFFHMPYATWNGNRIVIKGISNDSSSYYNQKGTLLSQRYQLEIQLFADVSETCDSIQVTTRTIFDPYVSYYHFETTKESQAFINIYFDLMELQRRLLHKELVHCKNNPKQVEVTYQKAMDRAKQMSDNYFKEVQRGTNKAALQKWNKIIVEELKIDNIALFGVEL